MMPDQNTTGFSVTRLNGFSRLRLSPSPPKAESERSNENSGMIKIDNLRRLHTESAFAEENAERIRRLVIGDLQNSLIDREDDDLARTIGFVADMQRFARLGFRRGLQIDLEPALFDIGGERHDAITERADENFFGIERADKSDIDITTAFKTLRQTNVLNAARRCSFETSCSRKLFRARS